MAFESLFIRLCVQVVTCPFLREKRTDNFTTVLQPCQVFFQKNDPLGSPQTMEVSIHALTLKVGASSILRTLNCLVYW